MKKVLTLMVLTLLVVGCSQDSPFAPTTDSVITAGAAFQRPEFIDNRPQDVQAAFTLRADDAFHIAYPGGDKSGKYALVIGISDYEGTVNDLQYCDDDARDWIAYLQTQGYQVTSLIDGVATEAAFSAAVGDLAALSVAGNEIVFAYSGHGSKGNMISADLHYMSDDWFGAMFADATSTAMFFSFDACQIGDFATVLRADGRVIACGSDAHHFSYDGTAEMQNGVFTYYQMEGLNQAGLIFAEDDSDYAVVEMLAWGKTYHVKVTPFFVDYFTGDLDF